MSVSRALSVGLAALLLASCSAKYLEYHPATEIPEGPGLFSGEDGEFVLYSSGRKKQDAGSVTRDPAEADPRTPEDYREFREFQEFRRWKAANRDTPDYREFQEWREWKAYRAWKERAE